MRIAHLITRTKKLLKPIKKYKPFLKIVYIFGSVARNEAKKTSDIDIMVIYDDTKSNSEKVSEEIRAEMKEMKESAKKIKLNISFQDLMGLTDWWSLVREGEPWVISSLDKPYTIYDDTGYLKLISSIVQKHHVYNRPEKVERLVDRTFSYTIRNREILLDALAELFLASVEAAQIFLISKGTISFDPKKMVIGLQKYKIQTLDYFIDIVDLMEKVNKGVLSEFSAENVDHYQEKIRAFVNELEENIVNYKES